MSEKIKLDERQELEIRNSMFYALVSHALSRILVDERAMEDYARSAVDAVMERLTRDGLLG